MTITFEDAVIEWRGPAPFLFVPVPEAFSQQLKASLQGLSYGWGCIPASARTGQTGWTTSLMPHNGRYLVPIKTVVQRAEGVQLGDRVTITLDVG